MRRLLILAATFCATGVSPAAPVEHSGVPAMNLGTLGHYGLNVPVKQGLKAITPDGWAIYVHREVRLPPSVSWQGTDTWVDAIKKFSDLTGFPVMVDWNSRSIYVKPAPVEAPNPTALPDPAPGTAKDKVLPVAVPAPELQAEDVFRQAADSLGFSVNWTASKVVIDKAPVVDGLSPEAAFEVLALAIAGKASVTLEQATKTVHVQPGSDKYTIKAPPVVARTSPGAAVPAEPMAEAKPAPAPEPVPASVVLSLREGQSVASALRDLAESQGWRMRWEAPEDFEAVAPASVEGPDLRAVLEKTLPRMGLAADRYPEARVIVIRPRS